MTDAVLGALWLGALVFQIGSVLVALTQPGHRRRRATAGPADPPAPISILVPVHGADAAFADRLAEMAALDHPAYEIIIASERPEPAIAAAVARVEAADGPPVRWIVDAAAPTFNPKVNVLAPAYRAARHDIVLMTDDNAVLSPGRLKDLLGHLRGRTGLVSAAAAGREAKGVAAELDAALMNGFVARYFQAADRLGFAYAIGKTLLFRRRDLDAAGGILAMADGMAEDSVLREKIAAVGYTTVLAAEPTWQSLGRRRFVEVWRRHLRWMAHRRTHAPPAFVGELLQSYWLPWGIVGAVVAPPLAGLTPWAGAGITWAAWFAVDLGYSKAAGMPAGWRYPLVWTLRELLLPVMWAAVLFKRSIGWRGRSIVLHPGERRRATIGGLRPPTA